MENENYRCTATNHQSFTFPDHVSPLSIQESKLFIGFVMKGVLKLDKLKLILFPLSLSFYTINNLDFYFSLLLTDVIFLLQAGDI